MDMNQCEVIGKELADLAFTTLGWEEPMDGDAVASTCEAFTKRLKEVNGMTDE